MAFDRCQDCLSGAAGEPIVTKIQVLEINLFGDELHEKYYTTRSLFISVRVIEPLFVATDIKVCDRVDVGV